MPDYDEPLRNSTFEKIRTDEFRLAVTVRRDEQRLVVARIKHRGGAYIAATDRRIPRPSSSVNRRCIPSLPLSRRVSGEASPPVGDRHATSLNRTPTDSDGR
ncbi:MAG: hypothetical protein V5A62_18400 [Haloarculaceae archaeon]